MKKTYLFLIILAATSCSHPTKSMYIPDYDEVEKVGSISDFFSDVANGIRYGAGWVWGTIMQTPETVRETARYARHYAQATAIVLANGARGVGALPAHLRQAIITDNIRAALGPIREEMGLAIEQVNDVAHNAVVNINAVVNNAGNQAGVLMHQGNIQLGHHQTNLYLLSLGLMMGGTGTLLVYKNHKKIKELKSKETFFTATGSAMLLASFLVAYKGLIPVPILQEIAAE